MKRAIGDRMCLGNKNVAGLEIALMHFFDGRSKQIG